MRKRLFAIELILGLIILSACVVQETNEPTPTPEIKPNDTDSSEVFLTEYTCVAEIASKQVGKTVDGNKVILFWAVPYYEDPYSEVNYIPEFSVDYDLYNEFEIGDTIKITFSETEDQVIVYEMIPDDSLYQTAHTIKDFVEIIPVKIEIGYGYYDQLEYVTLTEKEEIKIFLDELDSLVVYEEYTREHGFGYSNGFITFTDSEGITQTIEFNQYVVVDDKEYNYRWTMNDVTLNGYLKEKYKFE